jgi:ABC-type multidrug transport system fused ATPase/permease subunit
MNLKAMAATYREVLRLLPSSARRFLNRYSIGLALLSVVDAAALALLALAITPLASGSDLTLPIIGSIEGPGILALFGTICLLIIGKSAGTLGLMWRATRRFATYELELGSRLFDSYLESNWVDRLKRNSADIVRLTDSSVSTTISGFILPATTVVGELLSFVMVITVLAIAQPMVAIIAIVYLGLLGTALFFWVTKRAREAGLVALRYSLRSSRLITEMVGALKEVSLRNKTTEAAAVVRGNRSRSTRARSNSLFLGQVPRFALDSGIVGGFALVGIAGFLTSGLVGATTAIALFGLAGFRLAPSIVRFQSVITQVSVSHPHALAVVTEIERSELHRRLKPNVTARELPLEPREIRFEGVSFQYEEGGANAVTDVTLSIPIGSAVAFVGSSGAGKSTLVDLVLGLIEPTTGAIYVDDVPLSEATLDWRKRIGYVPQDVSLFDASVLQNVALTWTNDADVDRARAALDQAQLLSVIEKRENGLYSRIGERGLAFSGGQRQRLGIARALYSDPLVLVMDEATSALDTATEAGVTDAIRRLRGSLTIITVAHRLATVKESDIIFFMEDGRVAAQGTFNELVASVPLFAIQAKLAGLGDLESDATA